MTEFRNSFLGLKVDREYEYVPVKSHKGLDVELPARKVRCPGRNEIDKCL